MSAALEECAFDSQQTDCRWPRQSARSAIENRQTRFYVWSEHEPCLLTARLQYCSDDSERETKWKQNRKSFKYDA